MADVVNLRRVKKARARAQADVAAAESRARHGRSAAERKVAELDRLRSARLLDGAALDTDREDAG